MAGGAVVEIIVGVGDTADAAATAATIAVSIEVPAEAITSRQVQTIPSITVPHMVHPRHIIRLFTRTGRRSTSKLYHLTPTPMEQCPSRPRAITSLIRNPIRQLNSSSICHILRRLPIRMSTSLLLSRMYPIGKVKDHHNRASEPVDIR
jgi:hypothetical protein